MRHRPRTAVVVLGLGFGLVWAAFAWVSFASAHSASTFYAKKWVNDKEVNWGFTPSGSTGSNWYAQVERGFAQWNAVGQPMKFLHQTPGGLKDYTADWDPYSCPPVEQRNGIHRRKIDGQWGTWGQTHTCAYGTGELHSFQIVIDTSESWYTGTGSTPSGQADLWSIASHEAGHATGFSPHFSTSETICKWVSIDADNPLQTMCPYTRGGTSRWRSLELHDRHTFDAAY